ncbi:unnamed protein product [Urochloa humidicola]
MKSIWGATTTNRFVVCRSGESAQPKPGFGRCHRPRRRCIAIPIKGRKVVRSSLALILTSENVCNGEDSSLDFA